MFLSIALQYGRPKQVSYVKDTLQPLIWAVVDGVVNDDKLDLETDPCIVSILTNCLSPNVSHHTMQQIYRSQINIEEMRTGMKSNKLKDTTYQNALMDPETRKVFIHSKPYN